MYCSHRQGQVSARHETLDDSLYVTVRPPMHGLASLYKCNLFEQHALQFWYLFHGIWKYYSWRCFSACKRCSASSTAISSLDGASRLKLSQGTCLAFSACAKLRRSLASLHQTEQLKFPCQCDARSKKLRSTFLEVRYGQICNIADMSGLSHVDHLRRSSSSASSWPPGYASHNMNAVELSGDIRTCKGPIPCY